MRRRPARPQASAYSDMALGPSDFDARPDFHLAPLADVEMPASVATPRRRLPPLVTRLDPAGVDATKVRGHGCSPASRRPPSGAASQARRLRRTGRCDRSSQSPNDFGAGDHRKRALPPFSAGASVYKSVRLSPCEFAAIKLHAEGTTIKTTIIIFACVILAYGVVEGRTASAMASACRIHSIAISARSNSIKTHPK